MTHFERKLKPHNIFMRCKKHIGLLENYELKDVFLLLAFLFSFFPSCKTHLSTSHSSSHAFNSTNDTHWKEIVTPTTYSWDAKNALDLIDSKYFKECLNTFDECITKAMSTHVSRIVNESSNFHVKNKMFLNFPKDYVFSFTKTILWFFFWKLHFFYK